MQGTISIQRAPWQAERDLPKRGADIALVREFGPYEMVRHPTNRSNSD